MLVSVLSYAAVIFVGLPDLTMAQRGIVNETCVTDQVCIGGQLCLPNPVDSQKAKHCQCVPNMEWDGTRCVPKPPPCRGQGQACGEASCCSGMSCTEGVCVCPEADQVYVNGTCEGSVASTGFTTVAVDFHRLAVVFLFFLPLFFN